MRNLIIKTVAITLAGILAFLVLLYSCLAVFFPYKLADFYLQLGQNQTAVKYMQKQYEKTEDYSDLYVLCSHIDGVSDEKAIEYLALLVQDENAKEYLKNYDKASSKISTYEYFNGLYACKLYSVSGVQVAVDFAKTSVEDGYTDFNVYSILISEYSVTFTKNEVGILLESLNSLEITDNVYLERDIAFLQDLM